MGQSRRSARRLGLTVLRDWLHGASRTLCRRGSAWVATCLSVMCPLDTSPPPILKRMNGAHLARFQALAEQAEGEGYQFLERMVTEWKAGTLDFSGPGEVAVVVEVADEIVGVGGLCRDPYTASQRIGRIRHMYIHPAHRGWGMGAMLLTKIMAYHTVHFDRLHLRAANARSGKFYELHGFTQTCTEQHCTHVFR